MAKLIWFFNNSIGAKCGAVLLGLLLVHSCGTKKNDKVYIALESEVEIATPVVIKINEVVSEVFTLNKEVGDVQSQVPFQVSRGQLFFVQTPSEGNEKVAYYFSKGETVSDKDTHFLQTKENGDLKISQNKKSLLEYRYEMMYPPEGVDSIYGKSGYIHPIMTPKGDTLTRIQAPDHYHHYGLWGPWTHTRIDTTRVDFWNLKAGNGTVLFKEIKEAQSGNVFSSFTAAQEHIDFKTKKQPQVAINEDLNVRLWNLNRSDRYMLDYTSTFSSPLENGILFEAYRYGGGLGFRFAERWKADNCSVLTSEGKDRLTADGTNARWAIVSGASSDGLGTNGILFMSYPENRMHPEPMRVWPIDGNGGRGDMFFEFCPIRHEEWRIEPNKKYQLKYRMVVFDGELSAEEADAYWQAFANPPRATIDLTKQAN